MNRELIVKVAVSRKRRLTSGDGQTAGRVVMNRTASRLRITGRDGAVLTLAPFERLPVPEAQLAPFDLSRLMEAGVVSESPASDASATGRSIVAILVTGVAGVAGFWLGGWRWLAAAAGVVVVGALAWALWWYSCRHLLRCLRGMTVSAVQLAGLAVHWIRDHLSLAAVVSVSLLIPAAAVASGQVGRPSRDELFGLAMQVLVVWTLSVTPALLYFLFDREQSGVLSGRFVRHVFRLDPSIVTMRDLEAKYGAQMREAFGAWSDRRRSSRLLHGRRSPLVLATLLITIGWVLTLLGFRSLLSAGGTAKVVEFLGSNYGAVLCAFFGAYFFTVQAVLRGYVRRDLQPKTYSRIAVHFISVAILAAILAEISPNARVTAVLAFLTGAFPETGLRYLLEFLDGARRGRRHTPSLHDRAPLTDLQGIDLYDRTRLWDEGVTNIEALAHSNLVELMLRTRIPAARLVDWVDQAILYLRLGVYDEDDPEADDYDLLRRLRQHGVRTATDLLQTHEAAVKRGENGPYRLFEALAGESGKAGVRRLQVILDGLEDEEWLLNIRHWKECSQRQEEVREEACPAPSQSPVEAHGPQVSDRELVLIDPLPDLVVPHHRQAFPAPPAPVR